MWPPAIAPKQCHQNFTIWSPRDVSCLQVISCCLESCFQTSYRACVHTIWTRHCRISFIGTIGSRRQLNIDTMPNHKRRMDELEATEPYNRMINNTVRLRLKRQRTFSFVLYDCRRVSMYRSRMNGVREGMNADRCTWMIAGLCKFDRLVWTSVVFSILVILSCTHLSIFWCIFLLADISVHLLFFSFSYHVMCHHSTIHFSWKRICRLNRWHVLRYKRALYVTSAYSYDKLLWSLTNHSTSSNPCDVVVSDGQQCCSNNDTSKLLRQAFCCRPFVFLLHIVATRHLRPHMYLWRERITLFSTLGVCTWRRPLVRTKCDLPIKTHRKGTCMKR